MPTLTLDQVEAIAAERNATHNSRAAAAVRALADLRYALEDCSPRERAEIMAVLADELGLTPACEFAAV